MNTDDLRTLYGKQVHFNCQSGDEAFTDDYVLWLEKQLMEQLHKLSVMQGGVLSSQSVQAASGGLTTVTYAKQPSTPTEQ